MVNKIKVLTISVNAWNDTMATGNTFSNFLGALQKGEVANIFCRSEIPDNNICNKYFRITEGDIIKGLISFNKAGDIFQYNNKDKNNNSYNSSVDIYKHIKNYRPTILLFIREMLWSSGIWKSNKLSYFLSEFDPDIIYMHGHNGYYMHKILKYCHMETKAKIVLFFGDDMYGYKVWNPIKNLYQFYMRKWLKQSIMMADLLYGGSKPLCNEYSEIFNKEFHLLQKGCSFENRDINKIKDLPIKITYAGNLLYGRWKLLAILAREIEQINKQQISKIILEIYTQTIPTKEMDNALTINGISIVKGSIPYEEVKQVLSESDIVLHVESFEKKQREITRLSFSTKIIDCMQSGNCVMAIGPKDVASMQYIIDTEAALVVTSPAEIKKILKEILDTPEIIQKNARKMNLFARKFHNINEVQQKIRNDFESIK